MNAWSPLGCSRFEYVVGPSKYDTLNQCCFNVKTTLVQCIVFTGVVVSVSHGPIHQGWMSALWSQSGTAWLPCKQLSSWLYAVWSIHGLSVARATGDSCRSPSFRLQVNPGGVGVLVSAAGKVNVATLSSVACLTIVWWTTKFEQSYCLETNLQQCSMCDTSDSWWQRVFGSRLTESGRQPSDSVSSPLSTWSLIIITVSALEGGWDEFSFNDWHQPWW